MDLQKFKLSLKYIKVTCIIYIIQYKLGMFSLNSNITWQHQAHIFIINLQVDNMTLFMRNELYSH